MGGYPADQEGAGARSKDESYQEGKNNNTLKLG